MKLVYTELEQQLVFQENEVNVLVIERKELFRRMIQELDKQISGEDGGFVLSDNNKTMKIDKEVCLILNPFALDINSRKALTGLYTELGKLGLNEENYLNFAVNANGVLHAEYGSRRMYRSYFTEAERVGFECHAEVHENDWTAELKVPVKILEKIYGPLNLGEGSYFTCNFYKISESKEAEHYASYSPILSSVPSFHVPEFFADAKIVRQK